MSVTGETHTPLASVAVVGLGYVGLPTALALHGRCKRVIGIDALPSRLDVIRAGDADLNDADRETLIRAARDGSFEMTAEMSAMGEADAVIIAVPTPVTEANEPDLSMLRAACADAVRHARWGQTFILTSTTYIGTTRELLARPLAERGLEVGSDVFIAFSPERIDPGVPEHHQRITPRVVGGDNEALHGRGGARAAGGNGLGAHGQLARGGGGSQVVREHPAGRRTGAGQRIL